MNFEAYFESLIGKRTVFQVFFEIVFYENEFNSE
jgi:hypothetical protein